ncbi:NAD(P)/FAD-dependent oxidoreductase [Comamonas testosteroni]|uniref:FAD dependent oxidoreductase n=1 Tax=Comamonas testosteroni (strain DSM 14576 / KF-1) TaxID=399795 RepID=B7WZW7_COMTK|nr:NAD(P)/FAD-dependent oxidoreductase [Comamonas testosteroni]EED68189.1 FAD dependent oxidoreductase [Comamonas testosteroni KF-1]WQG66294.1 NAD(P)/FAD-dependent oxidoreductase [Comamonas testosteroni]
MKYDVIVIGCGMSGILAGIHLKNSGKKFIILEKAKTLGGTWRDNTYPGLTCDVPSHAYTYSFEPNPEWSRVLPPGAEIQQYFEGVFLKYGIVDFSQFDTEVTRAEWTGEAWTLQDQHGKQYQAKVVVAATGVLHHPNYPQIKGLEEFGGNLIHSARWDHSIPLDGKRIAIIGTGSTGVQIVSALASRAKVRHFQRTAQWIFPVENPAFSEEQRAEFRSNRDLLVYLQREPTYMANVERFTEGVLDPDSEQIQEIQKICQDNLDASVTDAALRQKLQPHYRAGCKRLIYSPDYYQAIQQPDSELITEAIAQVEKSGVRTSDGVLHEVDIIVLATGFKTDRYVRPMHVKGLNAATLEHAWSDVPTAYKSISVPGFPNFYFMNGPTSPVGNFSLIDTSEMQWGYISQLIERGEQAGVAGLSARPEALAQYDRERLEAAKGSVFGSGCSSWYLDRNGVPNTWPWSQSRFRQEMSKPVWQDYIHHQTEELAA